MTSMFMGIDVRLFSEVLLSRLLTEMIITAEQVIVIETERLTAGHALSPSAEAVAMLLSDQAAEVPELLRQATLGEHWSALDQEIYLLVRLRQIRADWNQLVEPQFEIEDLLDDYDPTGSYDSIRFFGEQSQTRKIEDYVSRVDTFLSIRQRLLNDRLNPPEEAIGSCGG